MAWKATFDKGVACYKRGDLEGALNHMNQAAELQSDAFIIYDSRAAVHENLGNLKAALLDSRRVIELAPDRWQGYFRSARLFDVLGKYGSAIKMVDHALDRLRPEDVQRHAQFSELRGKVVAAQMTAEKQLSQSSYLLGKLPVETLVEIFTSLIDEDHTWAIKLSHVCGHWRRILLNTPSAWQTLILSKKRPLRKVKLWKERARNRITRISIDIPESEKLNVFSELNCLSWGDLSSLRISGKAFLELHHILSDISTPHAFSGLEDLALFNSRSPEQLSCCLSGPSWKLKTLRMDGFIFMQDEWWERIQQLKELHVSGSIRFSMRVFAANPSLEKFVMIGHSLTNNDPAPTSMDNLKHVEFQNTHDPFHIACAIITPSITHFIMSNIATMADETLLHIASHPSLVELHISHCSLSPSTLPALLSSTPNLETLQINSVHGIVNDVFQFLSTGTTDPARGLPCRALKHIDVSRCSDLTTSSVYAFVKAREKYVSESVESGCAIVSSLNVDGCPKIEVDMLPWFRSKIAGFSCIYATKKDLKKDRRQ